MMYFASSNRGMFCLPNFEEVIFTNAILKTILESLRILRIQFFEHWLVFDIILRVV